MTKSLSIVIPALNEEEGIGVTIGLVPRDRLKDLGYETQIIVVDNGSEDETGDKAREAGAMVVHEPKRGYGSAYKAGFSHAEGAIIATCDADATYPVEIIPDLLSMLEADNLDFITTNRYALMKDGAMSLTHKVGNATLSTTARFLFSIKLKDSQSGMWVFRREILDDIKLDSDSMGLSEEIKVKVCADKRFRWKEVPIEYRRRIGKVKLCTWKHGFDNLLYLMKLRLRKRN